MDIVPFLLSLVVAGFALHLIVREIKRADARHAAKLAEHTTDPDIWEQSRAKDRAQRESVDAQVIRHLRGSHGQDG